METIKIILWLFQHVFITLAMLSFHLHLMKPTLSTKHIIIISLLKEGYSLCQIQSKTGLWKSTIGITNKEDNGDKRKSKKEFLSEFSLGDKSPIIHQTTNWRLGNAVEATHFIKKYFSWSCHTSNSQKFTQTNNFHNVIKMVVLTEISSKWPQARAP